MSTNETFDLRLCRRDEPLCPPPSPLSFSRSFQFDHDPRQPAYIATQGPLAHTVADFWQVRAAPLLFSPPPARPLRLTETPSSLSCLQMVWENGCTVIVMMAALVEDGEKQCERYWPDEGSSLYHIYEVSLVVICSTDF